MTDGAGENEQLPSATLVWITFGVVVGFAILAGLIFVVTDPNLHLDPEGFAVFAPIYLGAQAIERLLEPLAARYKTTEVEKHAVKQAREQKLRAEQAVKVAVVADPLALTAAGGATALPLEATLEDASVAEQAALRELSRKRSERALVWFMVASALSLLLAGVLGLGILEAMSTKPLKEYLGAIDVALTGLVIGAGTKPLHDLIVRLEKSKENADSSTKPTGQLPGTPGVPSTTPPATPPGG